MSTLRFLLVVVPWLLVAAIIVVAAAPPLRERALSYVDRAAPAAADHADDHEEESHAGHDHAGHDDLNSLELSKQAQANIGLKLGKAATSTFERSITVPGILRERPGRSTVEITAPLTGVVTRIYPIEGEAVSPGQKLFELRLTHEELVQAQGDFLRVAEELEVIDAEIKRLEKIAAEGGIPGRQVLERQYEQHNKRAVLHAQKQALLLHGLNESQVDDILTKHVLLSAMTVSVPEADATSAGGGGKTKTTYQIQELKASRGQSVTAGETLAVLADHAELFIEGNAFDKDVAAVNRAVENGWSIQAMVEAEEADAQILRGLKILYAAGNVDPESRTFHFYARLPNELIRDSVGDDGHRFLNWRYKPGQRVQTTIPVEQWKDRIVLPIEAVAQDGPETYVFLPNGGHFDRRPVHVEYRDRFSAVIAADGSIFPGDAVVVAGAQQLQLALKNKAGGAVDPHAGHNH